MAASAPAVALPTIKIASLINILSSSQHWLFDLSDLVGFTCSRMARALCAGSASISVQGGRTPSGIPVVRGSQGDISADVADWLGK